MDSTSSTFLQLVNKIFPKFYRVEQMVQLSDIGYNSLTKLLILLAKL